MLEKTKEQMETEKKEIERFNDMKMAILSANERDRYLYSLFINHGSRICDNHNQPSVETKKTFKLMEDKMTKIEIKMQKLEGNQDLHGEILKRIEEKIDKQDDNLNKHVEVHDRLHEQFASKETESDLKEMKKLNEQRSYDWIKFAVIQFILLIIGLVLYNKLGL